MGNFDIMSASLNLILDKILEIRILMFEIIKEAIIILMLEIIKEAINLIILEIIILIEVI